MRIVGIDPGYAIVGYGAVDFAGNRFRTVDFGAVTTKAGTPFEQRLLAIDRELTAFFEKTRPDSKK